jgi:hypothetical protein
VSEPTAWSPLTVAQVTTLARAAGLNIPDELVVEVTEQLNALREALERVAIPDLEHVEPA